MKAPGHYNGSRWRLVCFLAIGAGLNYADRAAMSAVLPSLRSELGLSDVSLGMLGSFFLWSYAICSPLAGWIADSFPRTRIIVFSVVAWSAVTALTALATSLTALLSLRIGLGITECLFLPAALALIAQVHPVETRGRAMSTVTIGINAGMVLGGSLAGYLAEHYGWRVGFGAFGLAGILLGCFAFFFLPTSSTPFSAARGSGARRPSLMVSVRYLVRVRTYHALLIESGLSGMGMWIFFSWLPLYFHDSFGLSLAGAGFAGAFMLQVCVVLGITVGGWVSDRAAARAPQRRMLAYGVCYLICAPFLLIFLTSPSFGVVVVIISCFSFFRGVGQANDSPTLCEIVPEHMRSTAIGFMNACTTSVAGFGVLMTGVFKEGVGLNAIFASIAAAFIIAGFVLLFAYRHYVQRDILNARAGETALLTR